MIATMSGDVKRSYGLFLGLAADEAVRPKLRDQLLFLGLIDLQDTVMGRKARNTGHKALRARAVVDLADHIGWERAHGVSIPACRTWRSGRCTTRCTTPPASW